MPESHPQDSATPQPIRYPVNHVLGIIDTADQVRSAVGALVAGGFLDSEVDVGCGNAAADAMDVNTGRTGLSHLAVRIATKLGLADTEMEVKERYEQALRDGRFVIAVDAPTDARKEKATQIITAHGGHFVNFLGRFAIEWMRG